MHIGQKSDTLGEPMLMRKGNSKEERINVELNSELNGYTEGRYRDIWRCTTDFLMSGATNTVIDFLCHLK